VDDPSSKEGKQIYTAPDVISLENDGKVIQASLYEVPGAASRRASRQVCWQTRSSSPAKRAPMNPATTSIVLPAATALLGGACLSRHG
jgi:hypothetical protein